MLAGTRKNGQEFKLLPRYLGASRNLRLAGACEIDVLCEADFVAPLEGLGWFKHPFSILRAPGVERHFPPGK